MRRMDSEPAVSTPRARERNERSLASMIASGRNFPGSGRRERMRSAYRGLDCRMQPRRRAMEIEDVEETCTQPGSPRSRHPIKSIGRDKEPTHSSNSSSSQSPIHPLLDPRI